MKKSELRQLIREEIEAINEISFKNAIQAIGANLTGPIKKKLAKPGSVWLNGRSADPDVDDMWGGMNKRGKIAVFADKTAAKIWATSDLDRAGTSEWYKYVKAHPMHKMIGKK